MALHDKILAAAVTIAIIGGVLVEMAAPTPTAAAVLPHVTPKPTSAPCRSLTGAPTPCPPATPIGVRGGEEECGKANLLKNAEFSTGGASTSYTGNAYAGNSASPSWTLFNNGPATITTQWLPLFAGRSGVIHVVTTGGSSGLVQVFLPFNTGPARAYESAWIYVKAGEVGIGVGNGGNTGFDAWTSSTGSWVFLHAFNGVSPANEMIIYSHGYSPTHPTDFYVDRACVHAAGPG
jgi:hypothetical protein